MGNQVNIHVQVNPTGETTLFQKALSRSDVNFLLTWMILEIYRTASI
jgi:hypothetical protein